MAFFFVFCFLFNLFIQQKICDFVASFFEKIFRCYRSESQKRAATPRGGDGHPNCAGKARVV